MVSVRFFYLLFGLQSAGPSAGREDQTVKSVREAGTQEQELEPTKTDWNLVSAYRSVLVMPCRVLQEKLALFTFELNAPLAQASEKRKEGVQYCSYQQDEPAGKWNKMCELPQHLCLSADLLSIRMI